MDINKAKVKRFREIVNELADLYEKKNQNYGDSFGQMYETLGPISGLVPLHNKLDRITNLVKGDSNHFESIEDNLRDLANYAIMNLIEMEYAKRSNQTGWWNSPGQRPTSTKEEPDPVQAIKFWEDTDYNKEIHRLIDDLAKNLVVRRSQFKGISPWEEDKEEVEYSEEH